MKFHIAHNKIRLAINDAPAKVRKLLQEEGKTGKSSVDVRAATLHTDVGVYPARGHSMPTCCTVMYEEMQPGDEILLTPPGGKGPTLLVRYNYRAENRAPGGGL